MHHASHPGLQEHSVGEIYPWTIRGVNNTLQGFHCLTGEEGPRFSYVSDHFLDVQVPAIRQFNDAHELAELWVEEQRIGLDIIDRGRLDEAIQIDRQFQV